MQLKSKYSNYVPGIQNGAGWPLGLWFQTYSWELESLRTWIFWPLWNSRIQPAILKTISARRFQLQPMVSRSLLVTMQLFWTQINPCLTSTFTSCQLQFLTNNLCNFEVFHHYKPSPFCSPVEYNSNSSWICVSQGTTLSLAQIKLFSIPFIDRLLIIFIVK